MAIPIIDTSRWPVVVITYRPRTELEEVPAFISRLQLVYERGMKSPWVGVLDLRPMVFEENPAAVRKLVAEKTNDLVRAYPGSKVGEAAILDSAMSRSLYTVMSWIRHRPFRCQVFSDLEPAIAWAREIMQGFGWRG